ncbi:MAG: hypothetical protein AAF525_15975, partial [Pseudomonadota bacterium]
MPNVLAYAVLLGWPVVTAWLFVRFDTERAIIYSFIGAFLFVPFGVFIDIPLFPNLDKESMAALSVLVALLVLRNQSLAPLGGGRMVSLLVLLIVVGPFLTVIGNPDPLYYGSLFFPGLSIRDGVSLAIANAIMLLPFLIGRQFLSSVRAQWLVGLKHWQTAHHSSNAFLSKFMYIIA